VFVLKLNIFWNCFRTPIGSFPKKVKITVTIITIDQDKKDDLLRFMKQFLNSGFFLLILVTATGGRPEPELCFLPG